MSAPEHERRNDSVVAAMIVGLVFAAYTLSGFFSKDKERRLDALFGLIGLLLAVGIVWGVCTLTGVGWSSL